MHGVAQIEILDPNEVAPALFPVKHPHKPIRKDKERPASKGRVHKGKTRSKGAA